MAVGACVLVLVCTCMHNVYMYVSIYYRLRCERVRIHTQLCLSITATQLTFLIGIERTEYKVKQLFLNCRESIKVFSNLMVVGNRISKVLIIVVFDI